MAAKKVLAPMVAAFAVLLAAAVIADARADIFSIVMSKNQADSIPKFGNYFYSILLLLSFFTLLFQIQKIKTSS